MKKKPDRSLESVLEELEAAKQIFQTLHGLPDNDKRRVLAIAIIQFKLPFEVQYTKSGEVIIWESGREF